MHTTRSQVAEDAVELLRVMGVLEEGDVQLWYKLFVGCDDLEFSDVSLGVNYLDTVRFDLRRECIMSLGLSPSAKDFGEWIISHGMHLDGFKGRMWYPNAMTGYHFGRSDHLILIEEWDRFGYKCLDLESWMSLPLTLGPPEVHGLRVRGSVGFRRGVGEIPTSQLGSVIDESQVLSAQAVEDTPVALVFREDVRHLVVPRLGFTPTFRQILECDLPFVREDELASFGVVMDGGKFEIGRWFGKQTQISFQSLVSFACFTGLDESGVRKMTDGVDYASKVTGMSHECKSICAMVLLVQLVVKDALVDELVDAGARVRTVGGGNSGEVVENGFSSTVGGLVSAPGQPMMLTDVLRGSGRLRQWTSSQRFPGLEVDEYVLRFRGVGSDRVLDGVWRKVRPGFDGSEYQLLEFSGDWDAQVLSIASVDELSYDDVPYSALRAFVTGSPGYSFVRLRMVVKSVFDGVVVRFHKHAVSGDRQKARVALTRMRNGVIDRGVDWSRRLHSVEYCNAFVKAMGFDWSGWDGDIDLAAQRILCGGLGVETVGFGGGFERPNSLLARFVRLRRVVSYYAKGEAAVVADVLFGKDVEVPLSSFVAWCCVAYSTESLGVPFSVLLTAGGQLVLTDAGGTSETSLVSLAESLVRLEAMCRGGC